MARKANLKLVHDASAAEQNAPDLSDVMAFKGVHALCTVNRETGRLNASHYAVCLVYGPNPTWGIWTVGGKFLRFASGRAQIEKMYPKLVWRTKMAEIGFKNVDNLPVARRRELLRERYGK